MTARNGHTRNGKPATRKPAAKRRVREEINQSDVVAQLAELNHLLSRREDLWAYGSVGTTQHFNKDGRHWPFFTNELELAQLRASSRILWGMSSYCRGLFEGIESYVFGDGLTYSVSPKKKADQDFGGIVAEAAQAVVDDHLIRNQWIGGEQPGLESEFFRRSCRDGESILCHTPNEDGTTDERFIEPDQLRQPTQWSAQEGSFGVRTPVEDVSRPLGYWITDRSYDPARGEEYDPDVITHFRRNVDRNVKRGIPDTVMDMHDSLHAAALLRNNLGEGAAEQAAIASVMEYENATGDMVQSLVGNESDYQISDAITGLLENVKRLKRGTNLHIPKGQKYVEAPSAANADKHIAVLDMLLRSAGRPWNAPEWLTSGDASNNNYASSLTAESPFVRRVKREQRAYCEALASAVRFALRHAIVTNGLQVNGRNLKWPEVESLVELKVTAPSPETRDKLQEAQRDQVYVGIGAKSPQLCAEEQGYDFERVQRDRDEFNAANPDMGGQALTMPGETGMPQLQTGTPSLESWLRECGGEGGKPGPCPDGNSDEPEASSPNVKIGDKGQITLKKPADAKEASQMLDHMAVLHRKAEAEAEAAQKLPSNDPAKVRAVLYLAHVSKQYVRAVQLARPFMQESIAEMQVKDNEQIGQLRRDIVERSPSRVAIQADNQGNITGATITPQGGN